MTEKYKAQPRRDQTVPADYDASGKEPAKQVPLLVPCQFITERADGSRVVHNASWAERIFITLEHPSESLVGKWISVVVMVLIVLSCTCYVLATMPEMTFVPNSCPSEDEACGKVCEIDDDAGCTSSELVEKCVCEPKPIPVLVIIEVISIVTFTVEYLLRLLTVWAVTPQVAGIEEDGATTGDASGKGVGARYEVQPELRKQGSRKLVLQSDAAPMAPWKKMYKYSITFLNLIDLVAILPFYLELFMKGSPKFGFVRVLRLARIFRIFRLGKFSEGLGLFSRTMSASAPALSLLCFFNVIGSVLFGSLVYFCEKGEWRVTSEFPGGAFMRRDLYSPLQPWEATPFLSIPYAFYWTFVTGTTVGYGEMYPQSGFGKLIAVLCMVGGVLVIALPITVIGSNFTREYAALHGDGKGGVGVVDKFGAPTPGAPGDRRPLFNRRSMSDTGTAASVEEVVRSTIEAMRAEPLTGVPFIPSMGSGSGDVAASLKQLKQALSTIQASVVQLESRLVGSGALSGAGELRVEDFKPQGVVQSPRVGDPPSTCVPRGRNGFVAEGGEDGSVGGRRELQRSGSVSNIMDYSTALTRNGRGAFTLVLDLDQTAGMKQRVEPLDLSHLESHREEAENDCEDDRSYSTESCRSSARPRSARVAPVGAPGAIPKRGDAVTSRSNSIQSELTESPNSSARRFSRDDGVPVSSRRSSKSAGSTSSLPNSRRASVLQVGEEESKSSENPASPRQIAPQVKFKGLLHSNMKNLVSVAKQQKAAPPVEVVQPKLSTSPTETQPKPLQQAAALLRAAAAKHVDADKAGTTGTSDADTKRAARMRKLRSVTKTISTLSRGPSRANSIKPKNAQNLGADFQRLSVSSPTLEGFVPSWTSDLSKLQLVLSLGDNKVAFSSTPHQVAGVDGGTSKLVWEGEDLELDIPVSTYTGKLLANEVHAKVLWEGQELGSSAFPVPERSSMESGGGGSACASSGAPAAAAAELEQGKHGPEKEASFFLNPASPRKDPELKVCLRLRWVQTEDSSGGHRYGTSLARLLAAGDTFCEASGPERYREAPAFPTLVQRSNQPGAEAWSAVEGESQPARQPLQGCGSSRGAFGASPRSAPPNGSSLAGGRPPTGSSTHAVHSAAGEPHIVAQAPTRQRLQAQSQHQRQPTAAQSQQQARRFSLSTLSASSGSSGTPRRSDGGTETPRDERPIQRPVASHRPSSAPTADGIPVLQLTYTSSPDALERFHPGGASNLFG